MLKFKRIDLCKKIIYLFILFYLFYSNKINSQSIDLEHLGENVKNKLKPKKIFKFSGGLNANFMYYNGNATGNLRKPFSYFFNGSASAVIYGISVPVSFNYTNLGLTYNYQLPQKPNRLSLHPRYKWITGHIGNVSMTFSPYTFSGYQFKGAGFDMSPKGKFKYSFFYGQLQHPIEYDSLSKREAVYGRIGYGTKVDYINKGYKLSIIYFDAKDIEKSLKQKMDSLSITPKQNSVVSLHVVIPIRKNLQWEFENAVSVLTTNTRITDRTYGSTSVWLKLFKSNLTTNIFHAYKSQLSYHLGTSQIGVALERIDPGYQTLGAYYFSSDLQNITVNFAKSLLGDKINLSGNIGIQKDDIDSKKNSSTSRMVLAANLNWRPSKKTMIGAQYSSFRTFTNIKPQFQYINQLTPYDNLDTLNFMQLSQSANVNINYTMSNDKAKSENININFSFQDAFDKQGGIIGLGNVSQFFNFASSYTLSKNPINLSLSGAFNITYNTIAFNDVITLGPSVSINKGFLKNKLRFGSSFSYNQNVGGSQNVRVFSSRINSSITFKKKHSFSLNGILMLRRSVPDITLFRDFNLNLMYGYKF